MKKFIQKTACMAFILALAFVFVDSATAWEQPTHKAINYEAARVFWMNFVRSDMEKYKQGAFQAGSFSKSSYRGIAVKNSGMYQSDYQKGEDVNSLLNWVVKGGDWADEPHLYASVRHFYDPHSMWGASYLTDQSEIHGWYDDPQTDALTWGLKHAENPFSFVSALDYYKMALEVPEDVYTQIRPGNHWKTDVWFTVQDSDDARSVFLGMAYRALGETMHMLADMTQPAHVRNDSHPFDEPIETGVKPSHVTAAAQNPVLDGRIAQRLASAGGALQSPEMLFRFAAIWTNLYFYSADTIHDAEEKVVPNNIDYADYASGIRMAYNRPQFANLVRDMVPVTRLYLFTRYTSHFYGAFNGAKIPMTQERLSFHWFDPDMTAKEKIGRLGGLGPYQIPRAYAPQQARALIPVATHACADLMHLFFPTMELTAEFSDPEEQDDGGYSRLVMDMHAQMLHHQDRDPGWQYAGMKINYTGPGKLIFADANGSIQKERELLFDKGELKKYKNSDGVMVEEPLCVYIASGAPLTTEEAYYEATNGATLYFEIDAGSRLFRSEKYEVASEFEVEILDGDVNYELVEGETEYEHTFTASASPPGDYVYQWDFGDGNTAADTPGSGNDSVVSNTFSDGIYTVTVDLYTSGGSAPLASDSVSITVIEDLRDYTLDVCNTWAASNGGGYGTTVDVWDISGLPDGTIFDIDYNAYSVPDKYIVQYNGDTVLDTGWRGASSYVEANPGMYPGGLAGTGAGTATGIFTKAGGNSFRVTVYGPDSGTSWTYSIKANCP